MPRIHKAKKRPSDNCEKLVVRAGGRCGAAGLKMFGYHFTDAPTEVRVADLGFLKASRICRHGDLLVSEIAADGSVIAEPPKAAPLEKKSKPMSSSDAKDKPKKRSIFSRKSDDQKPKKKRKADAE